MKIEVAVAHDHSRLTFGKITVEDARPYEGLDGLKATCAFHSKISALEGFSPMPGVRRHEGVAVEVGSVVKKAAVRNRVAMTNTHCDTSSILLDRQLIYCGSLSERNVSGSRRDVSLPPANAPKRIKGYSHSVQEFINRTAGWYSEGHFPIRKLIFVHFICRDQCGIHAVCTGNTSGQLHNTTDKQGGDTYEH